MGVAMVARDPAFDQQIVALLPKLRHHARSLCFNRAAADDLVQETVLRAMEKSYQFEPGTNLLAWLVTIEKNIFYTLVKKARRTVEDPDAVIASAVPVPAEQFGIVDLQDAIAIVEQLTPARRAAFRMFWLEGKTHEEISESLGIALGTAKSRVFRARESLAQMLPD